MSARAPRRYGGNGTACFPCPLNVTIPFRSFSGQSVLRSAAIRLFGEAQPPASAGGFACAANSGLAFSWAGDNSNGDSIPLGFANQVNSKTLLLPPRSLAAFAVSRFLFRVCYSANAEARLCGVAETAFTATISTLVRATKSESKAPIDLHLTRSIWPP